MPRKGGENTSTRNDTYPKERVMERLKMTEDSLIFHEPGYLQFNERRTFSRFPHGILSRIEALNVKRTYDTVSEC